MLTESHDEEQVIARVAALDIGNAELVCCVRVLAGANAKKRLQEVSTHSTMSRALTELANHLVDLGVERVVMEATSDYWKPVFYLLEAHGLDPWLVNARDVKHLPGRPKADLRLTPSGCASSPNGRCCARVSCRPNRSGDCGI
jgi:transposase